MLMKWSPIPTRNYHRSEIPIRPVRYSAKLHTDAELRLPNRLSSQLDPNSRNEVGSKASQRASKWNHYRTDVEHCVADDSLYRSRAIFGGKRVSRSCVTMIRAERARRCLGMLATGFCPIRTSSNVAFY